jgi:LysR family hydrogen peroxide-inducible transcriptional activator
MNIRDLKYLVAVARLQHFGHAAQSCHVSQPTLSGQIKKLEDELGVQLFERSNKKVKVTTVGEAVLEHAKKILELAETIRELAQVSHDPMVGPLRIGMIPTVAPYLIPLILRSLKEQYPQTRFILSEDITEHLQRQLSNHEIDAAIIATPVTNPDFDFVALYDEPFWLAHHRDDPLYTRDSITEEDLSSIELLLLADGHCLTQQVMNVCGRTLQAESPIGNELRASSLETLLQLVAAGYGATLVPALAIRGSWMTDMGIIARQIDSASASRRVSLVYRKTFPKKAVIDLLTALIPKHLPNTVTVV